MSNVDLQYGLDLENLLYGKVKEFFGDEIKKDYSWSMTSRARWRFYERG